MRTGQRFRFTWQSLAARIERALHAHGRVWIWWTILIPTLGGLVSGALLQHVVPGARGSGVPQVKVVVRMEKSGVRHLGVVDRRMGTNWSASYTMSDGCERTPKRRLQPEIPTDP